MSEEPDVDKIDKEEVTKVSCYTSQNKKVFRKSSSFHKSVQGLRAR